MSRGTERSTPVCPPQEPWGKLADQPSGRHPHRVRAATLLRDCGFVFLARISPWLAYKLTVVLAGRSVGFPEIDHIAVSAVTTQRRSVGWTTAAGGHRRDGILWARGPAARPDPVGYALSVRGDDRAARSQGPETARAAAGDPQPRARGAAVERCSGPRSPRFRVGGPSVGGFDGSGPSGRVGRRRARAADRSAGAPGRVRDAITESGTTSRCRLGAGW